MPMPIKNFEAYFASRTQRTLSGCWDWMLKRTDDGYGACNLILPDGRETLAYRASYRLFRGVIPAGMEIDHLCRNRACVNPSHLEAVPHSVNIQRGIFPFESHRNARKLACIRGHEFTPENTRIEVWNGVRMRKCRKCRAEDQAKRRERRKIEA